IVTAARNEKYQKRLYEIKDSVLKEVNSLSVNPGSGPRHITFHPNGKYAYVMTELSSEVIVLTYNPSGGTFTELQQYYYDHDYL
ncbi:beta-propeller fold lactonase family protein, partial [Bacillus sp. D-CC]